MSDHNPNSLSPNRRQFLLGAGSALALGATGSFWMPGQARAQDAAPRKGGHLIMGLDTASSSDRLDPAYYPEAYMY